MSYRDELIRKISTEATGWRRELHRNPQTMYEELYASEFVCRKMNEWGIQFERGIARTGVVATIEGQHNRSGRVVAFRADMDALDVTETSGQPWSSQIPGKMHACGHDGHTASLLALAYYLKQTKTFDGLVRLIFQPAEEGGRGAFKMIEEGLLDRFPFDEIYGFHNWPSLPSGTFATRPGPILAATDVFSISLTGCGGHAAIPHVTRDVIPAVANLTLALQTIVSRETDPTAAAVISITNVAAGSGADNVISGTAKLGGTVRTFCNDLRDEIEGRIREMADSIAAVFRVRSETKYNRLMDAVVNHIDSTRHCCAAAIAVAGEASLRDFEPMMGGEDFGGFLQVRPGAFMAIGQAELDESSPHNAGLHSSAYDFNDAIIPIAASYFAELAERRLPIH